MGISALDGAIHEGGARVAPVTTGADGRFTFTLSAACRSIRVGARAAGLAPRRPDVSVRAGVDAVVAMTASSAVRVRVVGGANAVGVPGANVLLFGGSNPEWSAWRDQADAALALDAGTTDAAGLVSLSASQGRAGVVAVAPDGARGRVESFAVPIDGVDVVVALLPAGRISGVVVSAAGEPVAQAVVSVSGAFGFTDEEGTAQDGTFKIEGVPPAAEGGTAERVLLAAAAPGLPMRRLWVDPPPAGATREVRISLLPWETLSGRVIDVEGRAVAGASVLASETLEWPSLPFEPGDPRMLATSAGDGSFTLYAFPPEKGYIFAWKDGGGGRSIATASVVLPLPQPLVVRLGPPSSSLEAGRTQSVRVVDAAGSPVAKALLEAEIQVEENALFGMLDRRTTDDEGRARLENLRSDRVLLVVHLTSGLTVGMPLVLSEKEANEREIRLPRGVVRGHVVDLDGKPAATRLRLEFVLRTSAGAETVFGGGLRQETAKDGTFRFEGVGDGEYQVVPDSPSESWAGAAPRVRAGSDLTLVLATAADESRLHLEAEWIDARDGLPLARSSFGLVTMKGSSSDPIDATLLQVAGTPGLWRSQSTLPPGTYDVFVRVPGYREARAVGVAMPAGSSPARLRQRLEPAGRIEGSVLGADGKPVPGQIEVRAWTYSVVARPDGSFVLAVASEGDVDVVVSGEHVRAQTARVVLPPAGAARLDVVVERAGALLLRLADGQVPLQALRISVVSVEPSVVRTDVLLDRDWISAHTPSRLVPGLVAGTYRITGTWDGVALRDVETVVREGETTTVDVHAPAR